MAAWQKLGILSDRRGGACPADCCHVADSRLSVTEAHFYVAAVHTGGFQCMLKIVDFSFSPPAIQGSLRTSTVHACNRTTGIEMSLIKKSDVKNHTSARRRNGPRLPYPVTKRDAAAVSKIEPHDTEPKAPAFAEDFSVEHSHAGVSIVSVESSFGPDSFMISPAPGSPKT